MKKSILNKILTVLVVSIGGIVFLQEACAQTMDDGAADSMAGGESGSITTTITTTTNDNGNISTQTETQEGFGGSGGESSGTSTASNEGTTAESSAENTSEDADKSDDQEKEEDEEEYDGLYNGFHIIPDIMAMHCKIKGEEVAEDPELFVDCIKQYVAEMNNPNATAKAEAEKEYQLLRYKILTNDGATAMTKAQVVDNHVDTTNKTTEAYSESQTESDDNKSMLAALSFVTNVLNDIRELQVKNLEYTVVNGIVGIDPAIVMEEEEKEEEEKTTKSTSNASGPNISTTNVEARSEIK